MQNITAPLWDAEFLAYRLRAGLEWKKKAQFEQDWKLAEMEAIRQVANTVEYHALCRSARCRRARRCVGNTAPCKRLPESELKPAEMQRAVENAYVRIQQQRRAAAGVTFAKPSSPGSTGRPGIPGRR